MNLTNNRDILLEKHSKLKLIYCNKYCILVHSIKSHIMSLNMFIFLSKVKIFIK